MSEKPVHLRPAFRGAFLYLCKPFLPSPLFAVQCDVRFFTRRTLQA